MNHSEENSRIYEEKNLSWNSLPKLKASFSLKPPAAIEGLMFIVWVGVFLSDAMSRAFKQSDEVIDKLVEAEWTLAVVFIALFYGYRIYRSHTQKRINESIQSDASKHDKYVLYLRPFYRSGSILVPNGMKESWERALFGTAVDFELTISLAFQEKVPVVSVGDTNKSYGAAKIISEDSKWKDKVGQLAESASCIFIIPDNRPGTLWELQHIAQHKHLLKKTIFLMPPQPSGYMSRFRKNLCHMKRKWDSVRTNLSASGINLPLYDPKGGLLLFDEDGEVVNRWDVGQLDDSFLQELWFFVAVSMANDTDSGEQTNRKPVPPSKTDHFYSGYEDLWNPIVPASASFTMNAIMSDPDFNTALVFGALSAGIIWLFMASIYFKVPPERKERKLTTSATIHSPHSTQWVVPNAVREARKYFLIVFVVMFLRSFMIEPFRIPSGSMMPTLLVGDFIFVNKHVYGIRIINYKILDVGNPQRGDIVVFRFPADLSIDYIKRVVGVPGDHVIYRDKRLFINGEAVEQIPQGTYMGFGSGLSMSGADMRREVLGDVGHDILVMPRMSGVGSDVVVPEGHYFVMGDNRDNSNDSRYWGFVPEENLVGKAFMIWMSWDSAAGGISWHRLVESVN